MDPGAHAPGMTTRCDDSRQPTSPPSSARSSPRSAAAGDLRAIERVRIAALGKKGASPELMATLGALPAEQRKAFGQAVNGLKARVSEALKARKAELERGALSARLATEKADITLPVRVGPLQDGRIHPVSQVFDEVAEIFGDMGFAVAEGPDIETDDLNFTKLNIPPEHPARQEHDTFYMQSARPTATRMLLRTHTSPVQIRTMLSQKPPIRIIVPGRVYRIDSDATHTPMFHQIEGAGDRRDDAPRPPQVVPGGVLQGVLRGRRGAHALPRLALPVHRAVDGGRHRRGARSASRGSGWRSWAAAWCTPTSSATAASIPTSTRASPSAWASTASPC